MTRILKERKFSGTTDPKVQPWELEHRKVARRAAAEGIVLLKNEDHILPLKAGSAVALYGAGVSHTIAVGLKSGTIKTTQSTPKQTSTVNDMSDEHEVDVFSRYFIGAYLTNSDLNNFISSKVSNKPFDKVTTTAVLLEKAQTKDKQTYEMTYVVSYNKDDKTKSSRFKFTVKKAKKAMYGYEVTKLPKESDYPG